MKAGLKAVLPAAVAIAIVAPNAQEPATPQVGTRLEVAVGAADRLNELRSWDNRVNEMVRANELALRTTRTDTVLEGRTHERYDQYVGGVRVFGGGVSRQIDQGITQSVFGTLHADVTVSLNPAVSVEEARRLFAALSDSTETSPTRVPELVVLPRDESGYVLAWRQHLWRDGGWWHTFLDAGTGVTALEYNDLQTQSAVGVGTGVMGDRKKISVRSLGGQYVTDDDLRPPILITYDMRGNRFRTDLYLEGLYRPTTSDLATDSDNTWTDGANVDAHVHLGWTYDYYFKRFGRRGLDDRDAPIYAVTHPVRRSDLESLPSSAISGYMLNAFWCGGCGPSGSGAMVFGEGLPPGYVLASTGQYVDYFAGALDIVAHELTHALTSFSSGLIYRNESGALNESFSDVLGTSVEFFYSGQGVHGQPADYLLGEDIVRPGGSRSLANPSAFDDPDHYSRRYRGSNDNGGVHTNSGIPNHAFYLAIEGGTNRTSGLTVQGVGPANREQIEKVFYRAFVHMLPSNATFRVARAATIQSARDLYGVGSPAERAVTEAWTAVGVN